MKIKSFLYAACFFCLTGYSQHDNFDAEQLYKSQFQNVEELKPIFVNKDVSTHFITPEKIKYVDISSKDIVGDIPVQNSLRIKPIKEGASGIVTIITEKMFVQYILVYSTDMTKIFTRFNVPFADTKSLMDAEQSLTTSEMYDYANRMFVSTKKFYDVSTHKNRLKLTLNNIYTIDKYFFIDVSMFNKSNIQFDIEQIRFRIEDKKQTKATNFQSVEISPLLELSKKNKFKRKYRNVFVFEKFTFPENKVFVIEISEKQISGRTILLRIDYADVLSADSFVN